jgi:hypothetical protein
MRTMMAGGNGTNINVRRDPWLRNNQQCITTTMAEGKENMKVSNFTDHSADILNREVIYQTFNPRDNSRILKLPYELNPRSICSDLEPE